MGRIANLWNKVNELDARLAGRSFTWPYPHDEFGGYFGFASTSPSPDKEGPPSGFIQLVDRMFRANPVVFACESKRLSVFSDIRFYFRAYEKGGRPGKLFTKPELDILENPWPRGQTGDLLTHMLLCADLGGNAYVVRALDQPDRLRVLRPDWVTIVMGDRRGRPVLSAGQLDAEIIGFIYDPKDGLTEPETLLADEVAHWAPIPDPLARFRGMSWLTPVIREVQADQAATAHKLTFFENGATPQTVVSFDPTVTEEQFARFVSAFDAQHAGWRNAYKTLYLGGGADVKTVGSNLQQLDFSNTQGKGETRIAAAAGIHPVLVPLSEGLAGSSLNAGNFAAARRATADMTFRPLWRGVAGCLESIVPPPDQRSHLWYDDRDVAFLREDIKDLADIRVADATAMEMLIRAGYTADSVREAVIADDFSLLEHTGLYSVQLIPPTTAPLRLPAGAGHPEGEAGVTGPGATPTVPAGDVKPMMPATTPATNGKG